MSLNGANGTLWTKGLLTASAGVSTTTLTTSDNIVVGAGKKIFVDRSALANNKLVLWDGGTGSTTAFLGFGINNNTLIYNVNTDDSHVFYHSAATELFRINNTAITASKPIILTTTSSGSLTIRQKPASTNDPQLFFKSGGYTNYGVLTTSTGLLHAWTTSNSTTGEPSGNYVYIPLNGNWTYTSDRRLKSDIKTLDCGDCCEKLMKINCCSYYLKSDEKKEKKNRGFIADEVKKIFPEFVSESGIKADDGNGYLEGITYTSFIPILVSAFQHMAEKVVNLEKENKTLLNILQDQANQLAEIRAVVFPHNAP